MHVLQNLELLDVVIELASKFFVINSVGLLIKGDGL